MQIAPKSIPGLSLWVAALLVVSGCDRFGVGGAGGQPPFNAQQAPGAAPNNGFYPNGAGGGPGMSPGGGATAGNLDQLEGWELQDMRVQPTNQLFAGQMHGATPTQIPGGKVISTKGLLVLLQNGNGVPVLLLDALGDPQRQLPGAIPAAFASQAGNYTDQVQQQLGQMLMQLTRGNKQVPIVTYCQGPQCWMSYNAALRAIALGYSNVLWYRGGVEAWQQGMAQMAGMGAMGGQSPAPPPQPYPPQQYQQQPYPQQYPQGGGAGGVR